MKDWKASLHLVEARYALTSGLRGDQVEMEGSQVWASNQRAGMFSGLDLTNGGASGAAGLR